MIIAFGRHQEFSENEVAHLHRCMSDSWNMRNLIPQENMHFPITALYMQIYFLRENIESVLVGDAFTSELMCLFVAETAYNTIQYSTTQ